MEKRRIIKKGIIFFIIGVLIIIVGIQLLFPTLRAEYSQLTENGEWVDFVAAIIILCVPILLLGVFMLYKANTCRIALSVNSSVLARVSKIRIEERCDTDGRTWDAHCVYINYNYCGTVYNNILWYEAETRNKLKKTLQKELSQFPKKGETFEVYVDPKKPNKVLSKAPFKIVN